MKIQAAVKKKRITLSALPMPKKAPPKGSNELERMRFAAGTLGSLKGPKANVKFPIDARNKLSNPTSREKSAEYSEVLIIAQSICALLWTKKPWLSIQRIPNAAPKRQVFFSVPTQILNYPGLRIC